MIFEKVHPFIKNSIGIFLKHHEIANKHEILRLTIGDTWLLNSKFQSNTFKSGFNKSKNKLRLIQPA